MATCCRRVAIAISPPPIIAAAGDQVVAFVVFVLIASIGVAAPVVISVALGARSRELLERLKTWFAFNNAVIMTVVLLVIGVKLIGDAIAGFSI